jgi:hypothetical protein
MCDICCKRVVLLETSGRGSKTAQNELLVAKTVYNARIRVLWTKNARKRVLMAVGTPKRAVVLKRVLKTSVGGWRRVIRLETRVVALKRGGHDTQTQGNFGPTQRDSRRNMRTPNAKTSTKGTGRCADSLSDMAALAREKS